MNVSVTISLQHRSLISEIKCPSLINKLEMATSNSSLIDKPNPNEKAVNQSINKCINHITCCDWCDSDSWIFIDHTSTFAFPQTCTTDAGSATLAVPCARCHKLFRTGELVWWVIKVTFTTKLHSKRRTLPNYHLLVHWRHESWATATVVSRRVNIELLLPELDSHRPYGEEALTVPDPIWVCWRSNRAV